MVSTGPACGAPLLGGAAPAWAPALFGEVLLFGEALFFGEAPLCAPDAAVPDVPPSREVTKNPPLSPACLLRWTTPAGTTMAGAGFVCRHRGAAQVDSTAVPAFRTTSERHHDTIRTTYGVIPSQRTGEIFTCEPDCGASSIMPSPRYRPTCWLAFGP